MLTIFHRPAAMRWATAGCACSCVADNLWGGQAHYSTLLRLKQYFPFSLIDAMGTVDDTKAHILRELRYQSSLDLDDATYQSIKHLPLARHLVKSSRQQLVTRLDNYCRRQNEIFQEVSTCALCMQPPSGPVVRPTHT